jgi:hypothetical protein
MPAEANLLDIEDARGGQIEHRTVAIKFYPDAVIIEKCHG